MNKRRSKGDETMAKKAGWILGLGLCLVTASAGAADAQRFSGTWEYAGGEEEAKTRRAAVDKATASMNRMMRGKARSRLGNQAVPEHTMKLSVEGKEVVLVRGEKSVSLVLGGEPVRVSEKGRNGLLSIRREKDALILVSEGDQGQRTTTFRLSESGEELTLHVRMTGRRLSAPLVFEAPYRRLGA
ncbi:MAG: hypothetical protein AAGJ19_05265 [Myxococcota bacterium]